MINVITLMAGDAFFKARRFYALDGDNNYHNNDNNYYF